MEWLLLQWNREYGETRHAACVPGDELIPLQARDSCDEREMVVGSSRCVTLLVPATNITMGARFGIRGSRFTLITGFLEARFYMTEIGGVVSDSMSLFCEID